MDQPSPTPTCPEPPNPAGAHPRSSHPHSTSCILRPASASSRGALRAANGRVGAQPGGWIMDIEINSPVRTRDDAHVGQIHRVVVDLEREAVTGIVVLKGHLLSRDILVPLEDIEWADKDGVTLGLTRDQLEQLP